MLGSIIKNKKIIDGHFLLTMKVPESFQTPMPGQFVMMREKGRMDPFLGRPFSIYTFERSNNKVIIGILYKVIGKGTVLLSKLKKGEPMEIFGPYGNAFDVSPNLKKVVFICGGIGIAPLTLLVSHYRKLVDEGNIKLICYYGATSADMLVGIEKIRELCSDIFISTNDGSAGYRGFVTEMFAEDIPLYDPVDSKIYACGPRLMLQRLSDLLAGNTLPCQISMEERMACGVGACLGCSIETQDRVGNSIYKRVCKDGPVFNIHDIAWR
jgi:dihydroorotate dehydrogenase electron transfer subunit